MLKQGLALVAFIGLAVLILFRGLQLPLIFYVLFPSLLFPLFFFYDCFHRFFFFTAVIGTFIIYVIYVALDPGYEVSVIGLGYTLIFGILMIYRRTWSQVLKVETGQSDTVQKELNTLRKRYDSRLESLHHLEKQVSSLMELFEIARDFSEALSLDVMSDLLYKKVMPILPFQSMNVLVFKRVDHENELESGAPGQEQWIFPLNLENEAAALLSVQGASPEDLVKFEVLVAHLVLQMKKIRLYETVRELSIIDGLTGVYVRRHFLERFDEELKRCIKFQLPLAVLMLDIDHFKRYNDDFGHLVGDATLKEVAKLLRESLRKVDIVARYGGEEFVIVIPETQPTAALEVAERIRSNIARHRFRVYDVEAQATVSVGISVFPGDIAEDQRSSFYDDLAFDLIRHADKALYRAKEEGRNRVFNYQDL